MSGAVAAHASYNGSGTQGLAVTNKISDSAAGDVVSVFWNETDTTRQLLYGSSTLEVPTSGSGKNASWGGSQIFTVNNDIDCLGDMYMSLTVEMNKPVTPIPTAIKTSLVSTKGGWGYLLGDGASVDTIPHAREVITQGQPYSMPAQAIPATISTYYVASGKVRSSRNGTTSQQTPGSLGNRISETGQTVGSLQTAIQLLTTAGGAGGAGEYNGGYFKKLSPGETHSVTRTTAGGASVTYNTTPPNGWAWIDSEMQIVDFTRFDLAEMVKFYNDSSFKVWGYAGWNQPMAIAGSLGITFPDDASRPSGGAYMTLDDAIQSFNWYQNLFAPSIGIRQDLINIPSLAEIGSPATQMQDPHWSALFNDTPEYAANAPNVLEFIPKEWAGSTLKAKDKFPLANIIKRVEFQVGTQIWQTLEYNDLLSINATEISESSYERLGLQTTGFVKGDGSRESPGVPEWSPGKKYQAFIPLKMLTKTLSPQLENFTKNSEDGYLMAAAPHQNVKVKVHYANFSDVWDTSVKTRAYPSYIGSVVDHNDTVIGTGTYVSNAAVDWTPNAILSTKLYAQHMIMCNEEREQVKNMPNGIPKRLKMTQNVNTMFPQKIYPDQPVIVDLDHFSLYSSHLIISASFPGRGNKGQKTSPSLKYAELKLNSSSFSGQLDGELLKGITNKSLGLYANDFSIDKQELDSSMGYYVFPLASRQGSGSSVPLNRFDNIRLSLTFTHPDITSSGYTIDQGTINVTCVGETTGLYKDGAASLAMY